MIVGIVNPLVVKDGYVRIIRKNVIIENGMEKLHLYFIVVSGLATTVNDKLY